MTGTEAPLCGTVGTGQRSLGVGMQQPAGTVPAILFPADAAVNDASMGGRVEGPWRRLTSHGPSTHEGRPSFAPYPSIPITSVNGPRDPRDRSP
jgi:hypothetical protein